MDEDESSDDEESHEHSVVYQDDADDEEDYANEEDSEPDEDWIPEASDSSSDKEIQDPVDEEPNVAGQADTLEDVGEPDHMGMEDVQVTEHPVENTVVGMPAGDPIPVENAGVANDVIGEYPGSDVDGGSGGQYGLRRNWTTHYDHLKPHWASQEWGETMANISNNMSLATPQMSMKQGI